MAKVNRPDGSLVSGKLSKKSKKVHRIRNGAESTYEMEYYSGPASKAQKAARSLHAKICAVLNPLMSDPEQVKALEEQMKEYNSRHPFDKFLTVRQFAYEQIKRSLLDRNPVAAAKADAKTPLPRGLKMYIKPFAELSAVEIYEILKARFSVFVLEQGIMYLDEDNIDYTATHLALRRASKVIAYARLFEQPGDNTPAYDAKFNLVPSPRVLRAGRMLTLEHGKGYGRILLTRLIAEAKQQGADILRIHAQLDAVPFYRHFRFAKVGEPFTEAGISHILMERKLTSAKRKK